jgi:hypothetical protein
MLIQVFVSGNNVEQAPRDGAVTVAPRKFGEDGQFAMTILAQTALG